MNDIISAILNYDLWAAPTLLVYHFIFVRPFLKNIMMMQAYDQRMLDEKLSNIESSIREIKDDFKGWMKQ